VACGYRSHAVADLDLVVLGDANPDLVLRGGDVVPAFGQQERLVEEGTLTVGGSGAIMACAAAKLGLRVAFVGVVGQDPFGRFMGEELTSRGIVTRGMLEDPDRPTGITVVLSRGDDRAVLTAPGTIGDLRGSLVDHDLLRSARHVHVSSYYLQGALSADLPALFDEAHAAGLTTSIDPNWDPRERWDGGLLGLLSETDLFLPNSAEARAITGIEDIDVAAESLAGRGETVAIKFGDGGGMVVRGEEAIRVPGIQVQVMDTTGAGDTFDAGYLAGHLDGWPMQRCMALANVCGGLSTRASGGVAAQPTMDEALERLPEVEGRLTPP
jgi:sugar/nucleoside kinase (ribokinase family)